jgi:hypothetical protein
MPATCALQQKHMARIRDHFLREVQRYLQEAYGLVSVIEFGEMKLAIFARAGLGRHVKNVSLMQEATGLGHVIANKGKRPVHVHRQGAASCRVFFRL